MNTLSAKLNRVQYVALAVGLVGALSAGWGAWHAPHQFFPSYLFSYLFWLGLSLGCLGVAMMQHLTGGLWGFVTRRFLEAGFMTLSVMTLLFVPLLFGLRELYPWARPEQVAIDAILQKKQLYLNPTAFLCRAVLYFVVWLAMMVCLRKWSLQQDTTHDAAPTIRLRTLSGPGVVIYPLTVTFAVVDWSMSIEPAWFSTIFPLIILISQVLSALALITVMTACLRRESPFSKIATPKCFLDLGNLLLAFVMFWTYINFAQYLIIYSGNLPDEISWYLSRIRGTWKGAVIVLALFYFLLPFFLLLFRAVKRTLFWLGGIAVLILSMHALEMFWVVMPTFRPLGFSVHWVDLTTFVGIGGFWVAAFIWNLRLHPLVPQNDPRPELVALLAHAN